MAQAHKSIKNDQCHHHDSQIGQQTAANLIHNESYCFKYKESGTARGDVIQRFNKVAPDIKHIVGVNVRPISKEKERCVENCCQQQDELIEMAFVHGFRGEIVSCGEKQYRFYKLTNK